MIDNTIPAELKEISEELKIAVLSNDNKAINSIADRLQKSKFKNEDIEIMGINNMLKVAEENKMLKDKKDDDTIITLNSKKEVMDLDSNDCDYLVIQGCGGDLQEWIDGITKLLIKEAVIPEDFKFSKIYSFKSSNLTNMLFPLDNDKINLYKLAMVRLQMRTAFGAMWLSDYIANGYLE